MALTMAIHGESSRVRESSRRREAAVPDVLSRPFMVAGAVVLFGLAGTVLLWAYVGTLVFSNPSATALPCASADGAECIPAPKARSAQQHL